MEGVVIGPGTGGKQCWRELWVVPSSPKLGCEEEEGGGDEEALHLFCRLFWGSCLLLQGRLGDVPLLGWVLLGLESRDGAQGRIWHRVHMSTCVCPRVCFHAAISAFAAASVAEAWVTELWLCSLAFPSLMPPGSCLSLTCLPSLSLVSSFCLVLSSLLSLVYAATHLPREKVH